MGRKSNKKKLSKSETSAELGSKEQKLKSLNTSPQQNDGTSSFKRFLAKPINKLFLSFLLALMIFYIIWATPFFQDNIIKNVAIAYAKASSVILNILGYSVNSFEDIVSNKHFSISIKNGCDGVEGLAIYLCALLIYPTSWSNKLKGMFWGLCFLVLLNLLRIISLFLIGIHIPSIFDLMHESVWQVLFIVMSILALLVFINQSNKKVQLETGN